MAPRDVVAFRTAVRAWFGISLQTFGGPAGQIAVMQRALVDDRRWISQRRFLHALNYCMLLPGPEAHQLSIYVGWLLNGLRGGLAAGVLFVLPGMVALLALSAIYVGFGDTTAVSALFAGLGAAVVAIVAQAVVRVAKRGVVKERVTRGKVGRLARPMADVLQGDVPVRQLPTPVARTCAIELRATRPSGEVRGRSDDLGVALSVAGHDLYLWAQGPFERSEKREQRSTCEIVARNGRLG